MTGHVMFDFENTHYFCLISKYIINVIPINVNSVMAAVLL